MYADEQLRPWFDTLAEDLGRLDLFDAHTHTGSNDPDGFSCTAETLLASLEAAEARAVVFTMHEPDGYREANDRILSEAASSRGRLVPFCRVDPRADGAAEAERCLDAGARGIKLHPRAERFALAAPEARPVFEVANARGVPVIVHAGRGIPALGRDALAVCAEHPRLRLILAHAGLSDLAWIWTRVGEVPNLFFDTSWWAADDVLALLVLVPPGRVLFGSDTPYGAPRMSAIMALRCALEAGLDAEAARAVAGAQLERLVGGDEPLDLGPAPGQAHLARDVLIDRAHALLVAATGRIIRGIPAEEGLQLAMLACEVPPQTRHEPLMRSVRLLAELAHDQLVAGRRSEAGHLACAAITLLRTPSVRVPE